MQIDPWTLCLTIIQGDKNIKITFVFIKFETTLILRLTRVKLFAKHLIKQISKLSLVEYDRSVHDTFLSGF